MNIDLFFQVDLVHITMKIMQNYYFFRKYWPLTVILKKITIILGKQLQSFYTIEAILGKTV